MPCIENRILRSIAMILVACALVLQSLAVALAFSDGAAQIRLDRFGNPICNTILNHENGGTGDTHHGQLPPCCTFGCGMFAPLLAGPAANTFAKGPWTHARRILFPAPPRIYIRAAAHDPGNPRAPPVI